MDLKNFFNLSPNYALVKPSAVIAKAFLKTSQPRVHLVIAPVPSVENGAKS
jgi:hypothetical protein